MANWIFPNSSKSRVNRAGNAIKSGNNSQEDINVVENWRASHAYIINTFQANLRARCRGRRYLVGQRLKRMPTIIDKLNRQPDMQLARMHDIAGCRIIFPSIKEMIKFRSDFHNTRAKHERITKDRDQFNYIENPKDSGYRGIHDVYKYVAYSASGQKWNGLQIEIQYRTKAQHAWATAVETADMLTKSRGKFSEGSESYKNLFKVCSEMISRVFEKEKSSLPNLSDMELVNLYDKLESQNNIIRILKSTNKISSVSLSGTIRNNKNSVLIYPFEPLGGIDEKNIILRVASFDTTKDALQFYEEQEIKYKNKADVVLVKSDDVSTLKKVFQNYFTDARDFIKYIDRSRRVLSGPSL